MGDVIYAIFFTITFAAVARIGWEIQPLLLAAIDAFIAGYRKGKS